MATEQKPPFHKHIFEKMWAIIRDDWAVTKAETRKKMSREEKKQDAGVKWTEFSTHCSSLKTCFLPPDEIDVIINELNAMAKELSSTPIVRYREDLCYFGLFRTGPQYLFEIIAELQKES